MESAPFISPRAVTLWPPIAATFLVVYFENASLIAQMRQALPPRREYRLRGTTVLQVVRQTS
jgi:hypothetical protein